ncbi:MAG TPA: hypothetical protein VIM16_06545 [Mucilaginibacter sp.]|jgi:hypothetical protein
MNEISHYESFSLKFKQYLDTYLDKSYTSFFSCNNTLDLLVKDLEKQSGLKIKPDNVYIPKLKVDIVFAICKENFSKLILIEAKLLNQLTLKDYSQLVGYLQVAKSIGIGLLLLIQKSTSINKLSNDFNEIIKLRKLPMNWQIELNSITQKHTFKTGLISYIPNNSLDWVNTTEINGISSFEELCSIIYE